MRVIAYSIKPSEKEPLAIANRKKHEITLISNSLSEDTAAYAEGKEAVIVFNEDEVTAKVINKLADLGVKYITAHSASVSHIDKQAAENRHIKIAGVPFFAIARISNESLSMVLAIETIQNLDQWQKNESPSTYKHEH